MAFPFLLLGFASCTKEELPVEFNEPHSGMSIRAVGKSEKIGLWLVRRDFRNNGLYQQSDDGWSFEYPEMASTKGEYPPGFYFGKIDRQGNFWVRQGLNFFKYDGVGWELGASLQFTSRPSYNRDFSFDRDNRLIVSYVYPGNRDSYDVHVSIISDGSTTRYVTNTNLIRSDYAIRVPCRIDHQNRIWVGGRGLATLDESTGKFTAFSFPEVEHVRNLAFDLEGNIWFAGLPVVGNSDSGGHTYSLYRFNIGDSSLAKMDTVIAVPQWISGEIYSTEDGQVLFNDFDNIYRYNSGTVTTITAPFEPPMNIYQYTESDNGEVFIITDKGQFHYFGTETTASELLPNP